MNKQEIRKLIAILIFILYSATCHSKSLYFNETFNSMANFVSRGWQTNFYYGRDGILVVSPNDGYLACNTEINYTRMTITNGLLRFTGSPNEENVDMQSIWVGNMVKYNGVEFTASAENPFGFEVIRKFAWVDPIVSCKGPSERQQCDISVWLISENDIANDYEQFNEYVCFYDYSQAVQPGKTYDTSISRFGYFFGIMHHFDIGQAKRPDGRTINLTNRSIFSCEWNYDDDRTPSGDANTNDLGIRITHNGSEINFYLNPNPNGFSIGYPNEYCWVGKRLVTWNNRLKMMLGHEVIRYDQERVHCFQWR